MARTNQEAVTAFDEVLVQRILLILMMRRTGICPQITV